MKYLYLIILIIVLLCWCIDNPKPMTKAELHAYEFRQEQEAQYKANNVSKPYHQLQIQAVQRYDNYISVNGTVEIYNKSGYPFTPVAEIDVEYGIGNIEFDERNYSVFTHSDYYTVFNGLSDFYDKWYMDKEYAPLPHHVMTGDSIPVNLQFEDIVKVGYFEPQEHQLINLNNQTSFEFDICVLSPHGAVKNPVLCFVNDLTNPYEGHEFKRYHNSPITTEYPVSLERVSGSHFHISSDITHEVMDAGCVQLQHHTDDNGDRWIFGGYCGRVRINFNMIRYDDLTEMDIMHVYLDDLDGYLNRDIMFYAKASPVHIATIVGG